MTTNRQTCGKQVCAHSLSPLDNALSKPLPANETIDSETDLNQFSSCNVRRKRIEVLVEVGRRILEESPNIPPASLAKALIQKAMDLWEVQPRTAKDYLRRVMPRLEKIRSSSIAHQHGLNDESEDYARTRDYVDLLRQNPTHDGQEES
jgi:hypothetical protein